MEGLSYAVLYESLTNDQKQAMGLLIKKRNVFLTGEAGTGKSYVVNVFTKYCEENGVRMAKCAPTGIAATEINGSTIHHQFEMDLGPQTETPYIYPDFLDAVDVLLIDEISMCRIDIFERIMLQVMRANNMPQRMMDQKFIQIVLVGDFFQLPPVITDKDRRILEQYYTCDIGKGYAFQSNLWKEMGFRTVNLTTIIRQQDKEFCDNLYKARHGDYSCIRYIEDHSSTSAQDITNSVCLAGRNATAKSINLKGLDLIEGELFASKVMLEGKIEPGDYPCEEEFSFKVNSRVMSLLNHKEGLYNNGTLGTIKAYNKKTGAITVEFDNGITDTIVKHTFENCEYVVDKTVNNSAKIKEYEQLKSELEAIYITEPDLLKREQIQKEIDNYTRDIKSLKSGKDLKLKKQVIGSATQYPLKLAYAITIHKSQGQTFEHVNIIPEIFDDGQFYVAISRCKTIENVHFVGAINPNKIKSNKEVEEFYADSDNYSFFDKKFVEIKVPRDKYADLIYDLITDEAKYNYIKNAMAKYNQGADRLSKIQAVKARLGR